MLLGIATVLPIGLLCRFARPLLGIWLSPDFQISISRGMWRWRCAGTLGKNGRWWMRERVAWMEGDCPGARANWEQDSWAESGDQVTAFWLF